MNNSVSIIVCTRNRAESLKETLKSIGQCQIPDDLTTELLIVDNGSTDNTADVTANANLANMPVRYILETNPGLSYARNRSMREASGNIFLFTDDDVRVPHDWLERMCRPLVDGRAHLVAGSVRMADHLRRDWMGAIHRSWLLDVDLSRAQDPAGFVGANFAFKRSILDRIPGFDVRLGAGASGFCEDSLFAGQVAQSGYKIVSAGECFVIHHFDADRLSRRSLLSRAYTQGRSGAHLAYHWYYRSCKLSAARAAFWWSLRAIRRGQYLLHRPSAEGCPAWELNYTEKLAYALQYAKERHAPRRYDRLGMQPIGQRVAALK